jgi:hypothetical protein
MIAIAGYSVMFLSGTVVAIIFAVAVWFHHLKK